MANFKLKSESCRKQAQCSVKTETMTPFQTQLEDLLKPNNFIFNPEHFLMHTMLPKFC